MTLKTVGRFSLVAMLAANMSGCATYMPARMPGQATMPDSAESRVGLVTVGAPARAVLVSGESVAGEVTAVSDSSLTIGHAGNYGFQERTVSVSELARLEVENQSSLASRSVGVVAVAITAVALGIVILAARIGHINGEF